MRIRASITCIVLASAMHAARASDVGAGCGSPAGGYDKQSSCVLVFRGLPLYVFGTATGAGE